MGWEAWPVIGTIISIIRGAYDFLRRRGAEKGQTVSTHGSMQAGTIFTGPVKFEGAVTFVALTDWVDGLPWTTNQKLGDLFEQGISCRWQGEYEEAVRLFRAGLGLKVTSDEKVALLILIGNCFLEQGRFEEAEGHYREAEKLAQDANVSQGIVVAKTVLAYRALTRGDLYGAVQYQEEASRALSVLVGEDPDVWALQAAVRNLIGFIHVEKQELQNAWDNFQTALVSARKTEIPIMEVDALFGLGLVCLIKGEWQRAEDELNKALAIVSTSNWYFAKGGILAALAEAYGHKGERSRGLELHREALDIFVRIGNTELTNRAINRLAELESEEQK